MITIIILLYIIPLIAYWLFILIEKLVYGTATIVGNERMVNISSFIPIVNIIILVEIFLMYMFYHLQLMVMYM